MKKVTPFIEISNAEIYQKLITIERKLDYTNGKVRLNRWISTTALSLGFLLIGLMLSHIL